MVGVVEGEQADQALGVGAVQVHAGRPDLRHEGMGVTAEQIERGHSGGVAVGAVTVGEIADALSAASGESVDKRTIAVANPIKTLGAHEVSVKLHDEVSAKVALNVVPS